VVAAPLVKVAVQGMVMTPEAGTMQRMLATFPVAFPVQKDRAEERPTKDPLLYSSTTPPANLVASTGTKTKRVVLTKDTS